MVNPWFKFYGLEYLSDPKIQRLDPSSRSVWVTILCLASAGAGGVVKHVTADYLRDRSGLVTGSNEWANIGKILEFFEEMGMVELVPNVWGWYDTIKVKNWEKRQETALTNAERQARYRDRNRNEKVTGHVTKVTIEKNRKEKIPGISKEIPALEGMVEERLDSAGDLRPPRKKKDNFAKDYDALCDWADARRDFAFVERGKQYKWLKIGREGGISRERLKNRWIKQEGESWREGKVDWKTVVESFNTEK